MESPNPRGRSAGPAGFGSGRTAPNTKRLNGRLIEAAQLPSLRETFYAVTLSRRFPNPLLRTLIDTGWGDEQAGSL